MAQLYLTGGDEQNSELDLLLQDNLYSMGSAVTTVQGSLAWCEAYAIALSQMAKLNYIRLISNQLDPMQMNIYARRFAAIYGLSATGNKLVPDNLAYLQSAIALKQQLFGTPNTLTNVESYIASVLGTIFLGVDFVPELQPNASPATSLTLWFSPLSLMLIRVWQPRDNQDNILMPVSVFNTTVDSYKAFVQNWLPAYGSVSNEQLLYVGNLGYGIDSSGTNGYPTAIDPTVPYGSTNTVSASAGSRTITGGAGTAFLTDIATQVNGNGWFVPFEVVDDAGVIQTYHVGHVSSNSSLTTVETIKNSITNRSYRLLGIQMDTSGVLDTGLFNG